MTNKEKQREIKFEAWDSEKKIMYKWNPEFFSDMSPVTRFDSTFPTAEDGIILRQFIGLLDKNGKEIYEGDILITSNLNPKEGEDKWSAEDFGKTTVFLNTERGLQIDYSDWGINFDEDSVYDIQFVEVVGNIYESEVEG